MFNASNLIAAYNLARIQEENVALSRNYQRSPMLPSNEPGILKIPPPFNSEQSKGSAKPQLLVQKINQAQMKDTRERGL